MLRPSRWLWLCAGLLLGCMPIVPATQPPQLAHTPGAYVVVDDTTSTYDAGVFRVAYPQGWRIVKTSIASTPDMAVVFVSPDEQSTLRLTTSPPSVAPVVPDSHQRSATHTLHDHQAVYLHGQAPLEQAQALDRAFERVLASLRSNRQSGHEAALICC